MTPEISAIVATLNRPSELKRLLLSIARQETAAEVIVVDQSDPQHAQLNAGIVQSSGLPIRYVHTPEKGTSRARNIGIHLASGRVLCFPDDDCEYPDGTFRHALLGLLKSPLISGQYVDWDGTYSYFPQDACDIKGVSVFGKLSAITFFVINQHTRNVLFDERLGGGGELGWSEEIDYRIRYIHAFGVGRYDPLLRVHHKVRRASLDNPEASKGIERARGYILVKNWRVVGLPGVLRVVRGAARDASRRQLVFLQGVRVALRR